MELRSSPLESSASRPVPTSGLARIIAGAIPRPRTGRLVLVLPNGARIEHAGDDPGPVAAITFNRWRGLWRMRLNGERGFADGFLDADWTARDLPALLAFFAANESVFSASARNTRLANLRHRIQHTSHANTRRGSRRNIAAHYDLGNAFYEHWLDRGMNYSSALYSGDATLEAAQDAKLDRVVKLLEVDSAKTVLEIGCGWGALAERLVDQCAEFTGVTLSREQLAYARERLDQRADGRPPSLRLEDYRDIAGRFDRIASIEMLEAVGERYWPLYFERLHALLAPGGIAVLQVITIAEGRFEHYRNHPDFIQRHIFPGGMLPTARRVEAEAARAGLVLDARQDFGESYARTLAEWRRRFLAAWGEIRTLGFDERFRRMWEYYLAYCETGFSSGRIDVSLFRFRK